MRRFFEQKLEQWKESPFRKPLLITGARQVGKTYVVEKLFGPRNFAHVIKVDFRNDADIRKYVKNHPNAEAIVKYLSVKFNQEIGSDTLLFFDEIQEAVQILTAAKYFQEKMPSLCVIMTGSLVRIKLKQLENEKGGKIHLDPEIEHDNQDGHNNFLFPVGKLDEEDMYPLTFDEFLFVYKPSLYAVVKESFTKKEPLDNGYHQMALEAFYDYLRVGGLPEAVSTYLTTSSFVQAQKTLSTIYSDYLSDMSLYQISAETIGRTKMVFEDVYLQLGKENKNFKVADLEPGKRFRDYLSAFDWLSLARLLSRSYLVKEKVTLPFRKNSDSLFRTYLPDCGLFLQESRINLATFATPEANNSLLGILMENYVAEELNSRDIPLFYWKGKTSSEFEFLLDVGGVAVPVDSKKSRGRLGSLEVYKRLNSYSFSIKVSENKYGFDEGNKILTLPFYLFPFYLNEMIKEGKIQPVVNH